MEAFPPPHSEKEADMRTQRLKNPGYPCHCGKFPISYGENASADIANLDTTNKFCSLRIYLPQPQKPTPTQTHYHQMNTPPYIQEYIDPDSGRRLVSVTFDESESARNFVIPFDLLADGLLDFLAMTAELYPKEVLRTDGFQRFRDLARRVE